MHSLSMLHHENLMCHGILLHCILSRWVQNGLLRLHHAGSIGPAHTPIRLTVVILLHIFAHVVFVSQLGPQIIPHVVSSVRAQRLRTLVSSYQSMHRIAFLTTSMETKLSATKLLATKWLATLVWNLFEKEGLSKDGSLTLMSSSFHHLQVCATNWIYQVQVFSPLSHGFAKM